MEAEVFTWKNWGKAMNRFAGGRCFHCFLSKEKEPQDLGLFE
jgi:hypothetical protein